MPDSTTELLQKHFDLALEAPEGIAKLRELILTLAMQGKLVPQDPNDEPASELLKPRSSAERHSPKKNDQTHDLIKNDLETRAVPASWEIVTLEQATSVITKGSTPTSYGFQFQTSGIPFVKVENVKNGRIQVTAKMQYISDECHEFQRRSQLEPMDILFSIAGTIGETCLVQPGDVPANINQALAIVRGYRSFFVPAYLIYVLNSVVAERTKAKARGAAMNNISLGDISEMRIPLPPLPEQRRIVAKVDQLMAVCDQLEKQRDALAQKRLAVHNAAIRRLLEAEEQAEFTSAWDFLVEHFGEVYSVKENVAELRKAILQLAILGQLTADGGVARQTAARPPVSVSTTDHGNTSLRAESEWWTVRKLEDVVEEIVDCPHSTPKWTVEGKICVRTSQFKPGRLDLSNSQFVSEETFNDRITRLRPKGNDILYSREGGILGVACRIPEGVELCLGQRMMLVRAGTHLEPAFLEMVLNSPVIKKIAEEKTTGGAAPRINVSTVKEYPIPLPPLPEQHRIVAKVNELMALCDRLEAGIDAANAKKSSLLKAVLAV